MEQLFSGSALTTLQCVNVEYQGTPRIEALFDIQLDVDVRVSDGGCPAAVLCLTSPHLSLSLLAGTSGCGGITAKVLLANDADRRQPVRDSR